MRWTKVVRSQYTEDKAITTTRQTKNVPGRPADPEDRLEERILVESELGQAVKPQAENEVLKQTLARKSIVCRQGLGLK